MHAHVILGATIAYLATATATATPWSVSRHPHPHQDGDVLRITDPTGTKAAELVLVASRPAKPYLNLFATDGTLLTQDSTTARFPHHRGFFIGWDEIESELGSHDLWHMDTGHMTTVAVDRVHATDQHAVVRLTIAWDAGRDGSAGQLLTEHRTLALSRPPGAPGATQVDLHTRLVATRALTLDGDLQHAGIHFRAHNEVNSRDDETAYLESPAGVDSGPDLAWCQLTFPRGDAVYTATLHNAPENPVEELSQRAYGRFGYFFAHDLATAETLSLNYRLTVAPARARPSRSAADLAHGKFLAALDADPDHDGQSTTAETVTATDPFDPASTFAIKHTTVDPAGHLQVDIPAVVGKTLTLEHSPDLTTWTPVPTTTSNPSPTTTRLTTSTPAAPSNYRLRLTP